MKRLIAAAVLMVASCTFPDVTFTDGSVPLVDATNDVDTSDASDDVVVIADAGKDVVIDPCDKDNDGFKSTACDGGDCDDNDPRVHPGADFRTDVPTAFPWGDWNCDGQPVGTPEFEFPTMTCSVTCGAPEGFASPEGCGLAGPWVSCSGLCTKADAGTRTQGCR